jgi:hypothetical protein
VAEVTVLGQLGGLSVAGARSAARLQTAPDTKAEVYLWFFSRAVLNIVLRKRYK